MSDTQLSHGTAQDEKMNQSWMVVPQEVEIDNELIKILSWHFPEGS